MRVEQLSAIVPQAPSYWVLAIVEAMPKFDITGLARESAFIGQLRHESMDLTRFAENLNYSNPERIARIFRTAFDLDKDKVVDAEEIAFAKKYVMNPKALANRAYAMRFGNGNEESGDGWRYRGRGPIQITFKDNYRLYGGLLARLSGSFAALDLVRDPDEALVPRVGAAVSCAYFQHNGCNELADRGDIAGVTKKINPGMAGLAERVALTNHSLKILEETR